MYLHCLVSFHVFFILMLAMICFFFIGSDYSWIVGERYIFYLLSSIRRTPLQNFSCLSCSHVIIMPHKSTAAQKLQCPTGPHSFIANQNLLEAFEGPLISLHAHVHTSVPPVSALPSDSCTPQLAIACSHLTDFKMTFCL